MVNSQGLFINSLMYIVCILVKKNSLESNEHNK